MHVRRADGTVTSAGDAATDLLDALPATRWLGRLARRSATVQWMIDIVYGTVAARRSGLARVVPNVAATTRLPSPPTTREERP